MKLPFVSRKEYERVCRENLVARTLLQDAVALLAAKAEDLLDKDRELRLVKTEALAFKRQHAKVLLDNIDLRRGVHPCEPSAKES